MPPSGGSISNSEVKRLSADDSCPATDRENRPRPKDPSLKNKGRGQFEVTVNKKENKKSSKEVTMADLLASSKKVFSALKKGDRVKGKIVEKSPKALLINIGGKSLGMVSGKALSEARDFVKQLEIGDEVEGAVLIPETPDGYTIISLRDSAKTFVWDKIAKLFEEGKELSLEVKNSGTSGVTVEVLGILGFVPMSHLTKGTLKDVNNLAGKSLRLKIIDFDKSSNRLILSEKAVVEAKEIEAQKELLSHLKEGEVYDGLVTTVTDFGAFVKLNLNLKGKKAEVEGLVRASEISWGKVEKPSEVLKDGDKVKVKVLEVKDGRLSLSIKQAQGDPWDKVKEKYQPEMKLKGEVVKISDFGAFVALEPGIEGLLHITKIPPTTKLKIGDEVNVYIDEIDFDERRIGLGLVLTSKPIGYK
jgi:ribosomal protein S1